MWWLKEFGFRGPEQDVKSEGAARYEGEAGCEGKPEVVVKVVEEPDGLNTKFGGKRGSGGFEVDGADAGHTCDRREKGCPTLPGEGDDGSVDPQK